MTNTKHTPGPWRAVKISDGRYDVHAVDSVPPDRDIEVTDGGYYPDDDCRGAFDSKIDATLCAAAPDLLAACEAYTRAANKVFDQHGVSSESTAELSSAWAAALVAIAKAKGET